MNKKYYVCFDVGLKGFFSIIEYEKNNYFRVIHSEKIQVEEKQRYLFKTDINKESKAIVKNAVSFKLNYSRIKHLLEKYQINPKDCLAFTEQLTPRPIHSSVSVFSMGDTNGTCRAIIEALDIEFLNIPPKIWKDGLGVTSDKNTSVEYFKNNIVIRDEVKPFFGKFKNDDQIESVLIAYWHYKCIL